jgi:hypothetical protein
MFSSLVNCGFVNLKTVLLRLIVITTEGLLLGDRNDTGLVHVLLSDHALKSKYYGCAAEVINV